MDNSIDHSQHKEGVSLTSMLALGGAAIVAGIVVVPYVAPAIGLGSLDVAQSTLDFMHNIPEGQGLAVAITKGISQIPFIGEAIAKGGAANIAATAVTGLGGLVLGDWMSKKHQGKEGIDWGKVIKWAGLATSALIALPSILTGVSNGLIYMMNEAVAQGVVADPAVFSGWPEKIMETIGTTPYQEVASMGLGGAAVTIPHLLTCGASLFPAAAAVGAHKVINKKREQYVALDTKGKPLPPDDLNHNITPEERALVETYNKATPVQKIIMKKELLEKGYNPDFHDDGTIHLHKHTHAPQASAAR